MTRSTKNIILVVVLIAVVGGIWYLESQKAPIVSGTNVVVNYGTSTPDLGVSSTTPIGSGTTTVVASGAGTSAGTSAGAGSSSSGTSASSAAIAANRASIIAEKAQEYPMAKEFVDPTGFINSAPFTLSDLVGKKVVLIDFWTYSCINCVRTIPYLNAWYAKYKDEGLEIVGVHTPEFDFEKDYNNVAAAVQQLGIQYPVVLDSNMGTWDAYQNIYWPADYLVDIDGFIPYTSVGEGDYDKTEEAIQAALKERDQALGLPDTVSGGLVNPTNAISINQDAVQSPETYFGSARNEYLGNGNQGTNGAQTLTVPTATNQDENTLYLGGTWNFQDQYAQNVAPSGGAGATPANPDTIVYDYDAKNVYMVAASADQANGTNINIYEDGTFVKTLNIKANTLYPIISGTSYGVHTLKIEIESPGLQAYTFTFG